MVFKDKKVLVTGGSGFVGTHFVKALLDRGARVRIPVHHHEPRVQSDALEIIPADLNDIADCRRLCSDIVYVIHAAGTVGAAGVGSAGMIGGIVNNLVMTARMLEAASVQGVRRMLVFSSSTTYPAADYPMQENEMWSGKPAPVYFGYGWMRRYVELFSEFVCNNSELKVAICRPSAIYGPYDNFDLKTGHVIPALMRKALNRDDPFVVWGTGEELRDFLYVTDLVQGCLDLLAHCPTCDSVNIAYGKGHTIRAVAEMIMRLAKHEHATLIFDADKPTTIPVRLLSIERAKELIGFSPQISLENGIRKTLNWYRNHVGNVGNV